MNFKFSVTFILSSAFAFNLDLPKTLSFGTVREGRMDNINVNCYMTESALLD